MQFFSYKFNLNDGCKGKTKPPFEQIKRRLVAKLSSKWLANRKKDNIFAGKLECGQIALALLNIKTTNKKW